MSNSEERIQTSFEGSEPRARASGAGFCGPVHLTRNATGRQRICECIKTPTLHVPTHGSATRNPWHPDGNRHARPLATFESSCWKEGLPCGAGADQLRKRRRIVNQIVPHVRIIE